MSKSTTQLNEFRALSEADLVKKITEIQIKITDLKGQLAVGKLKNYKSISGFKQQLAHLMTVQQEKIILQNVDNEI